MWMGLNIKADGHTMKETVKVSCNMRTAMNIMANGWMERGFLPSYKYLYLGMVKDDISTRMVTFMRVNLWMIKKMVLVVYKWYLETCTVEVGRVEEKMDMVCIILLIRYFIIFMEMNIYIFNWNLIFLRMFMKGSL